MNRARYLDDRAAFVASIDRLAPDLLREWNALAATAPTRDDIRRLLARWRLDAPGLEWLVDGMFQSVWSTTGDPWPMPRYRDMSLPMPAGGVLTHDMPPLVASWEPAETGERREEFRQRVIKALDAYISRVETWAREKEVEMPPAERRGGKLPEGRLRWDVLVRHLVLGESYESLALEYGTAFSTVGERVRMLADRLGITLAAKEIP